MRILAAGIILSLSAYVFGDAQAQQPQHLSVKFTLDWVFDGTTAYAVDTQAKRYFANEGLDVAIERGFGAAGVPLLVANGGFQFGLSDVSALIEYNARNPDKPLVCVMMVYDKAQYSLITLADRNIQSFRDLVGRKIGSFTNDTAGRFLPILARANGVDLSQVKVEQVNIQVRDSLLKSGQVDAVTGFASTAIMNLIALGVPEQDIRVLRFTDYGLDIYGSCIIATLEYTKQSPTAVRGFVKALSRGMQDTIQNPSSAIAAVKERNTLIDESVETRRLSIVLRDTVITPFTEAHGFGDIDPARLARQIDYVNEVFGLPRKPTIADVFTSQFLPPSAERRIPQK
jgi:NitT/TauT family transport system substrate-binding protein